MLRSVCGHVVGNLRWLHGDVRKRNGELRKRNGDVSKIKSGGKQSGVQLLVKTAAACIGDQLWYMFLW